MRETELFRFKRRLLNAGIRKKYADRAVLELKEHFEDLEAEVRESGVGEAAAAERAMQRLGALDEIADSILQCTQFKIWTYRYPRIARFWYPVAYATLLPITPVIAGIERAPVIARWLACAALGAAVTASMLLMLQLSILFA